MTVSQLNELNSLSQDQKLFAMAAGIIAERISQLDEDDRATVWSLFRCFSECESQSERIEVQEALLEVLDHGEVELQSVDLDADPSGVTDEEKANFSKWKEFIGSRVRESRLGADLTQEQLSESTGLSQSHISRIERGTLSPSRVTIEKIAGALKVQVTDLDPS